MKKVIAIMLAVVMCLALAACGKKEAPAPAATTPAAPASTTPAAPAATTPAAPTANAPEYPEMNLQISHINAVDHACNVAYNEWAELLKERTDGKITLDVYPASQLYGAEDGYDACQLGDLDMTQADISGLTAKVPRAGVLCLPMLYNSYEKAAKVFYGPVGEAVNGDIEQAYNFHPMGWIWNGYRFMCTNDPIDELADCKGYKLRVPGIDLYLNTFVPMGFTPVQTAWGEAYTAMQSGLCDGVETTAEAIATQGFGALGGNVTTTRHILSVIGPVINCDLWASFDDDTKALFNETWAICQAKCNETVISNETKYLDQMKSEGVNVIDWKDPQELIDLFKPQWTDNAKAGGYEDLFEEAFAAMN